MSDQQYETFQHYGTNAARLAFTPAPASGIQPIYVWYATDTGLTWLYDTSWHQITGGATVPTTAQGDLLYASAANTLSALNKDTNATRYLSNTGSSNNPAWAQVNVANGVTGDLPYANLAQGSALSVLGVTGNATADVASIAAASDHQVMRRSGTALAFGAVNLAQSAAVTGTLPVANGGTGITDLGAVHTVTVTLTNAQILALPSTPITIVAAQGANTTVTLVSATVVSDFAAAVYTNISATGYAFLAYSGTESPGLASSYIPNDAGNSLTAYGDLFGSTTRKILQLVPYQNTVADWGLTPVCVTRATRTNTPIAFAAAQAGSNFTGGNAANTLAITAYYTVEAV